MSRTQPSSPELPTDNAAGFLANLFRGTACIQEAFGQESGELEYLEKCWSDSAVFQFILLGWIGLTLKVLLFILLVTFIGACVQRRRPWYVFMSFVNGTGRIVGGLCPCFELDEDRERERAAEAGKGLGVVWREEKDSGGYFGIPKQKVP